MGTRTCICGKLAVPAAPDSGLALHRLVQLEPAHRLRYPLDKSSACERKRESNGRGEHRSTRKIHFVQQRESEEALCAGTAHAVAQRDAGLPICIAVVARSAKAAGRRYARAGSEKHGHGDALAMKMHSAMRINYGPLGPTRHPGLRSPLAMYVF